MKTPSDVGACILDVLPALRRHFSRRHLSPLARLQEYRLNQTRETAAHPFFLHCELRNGLQMSLHYYEKCENDGEVLKLQGRNSNCNYLHEKINYYRIYISASSQNRNMH